MPIKENKIPSLAGWLINKLIDDATCEEFLGDLQEVYEERIGTKGWFYAKLMFWLDTIHLLFGFSRFQLFKNHPLRSFLSMIKYNFKMSLRSLKNSRLFTSVNIAGLTFGLTCSLLISLWVWDEVRFDQFHTNGKNIYRLLGDVDNNGESIIREYIPSAIVQPLLDEFPEIHQITRVSPGQVVFQSGHARFSESGIYADSSLLHIFSFPLKEGKLKNIFADPHTVVISDKLAKKYFPGESALGKSISIVEKEKLNYVVTGVLQEIPTQSSLQFDFILAYDQFEKKHRPWWSGKTNIYAFTNFNVAAYVSLVPEADTKNLNSKLASFITDYTGIETSDAVFAFPFTEYYLHSDFSEGRVPTGKIQYVKLLSVIAFIVLLIACINFMNLATARAGTRTKEVGVRKIIGAPRFQLMSQFIVESIVIVTISMILAVTLAHLAMPFFNLLTGKQIEVPAYSPEFILVITSITIGTGILAGCYPAVYLSAFTPTTMLRGINSLRGGLSGIRNGLVIVQFALSIIFIVFTIVVSNQINFIQNKDLGIKKENIIQHPLHGITTNKEAYKSQLLSIPGIQSVGFSEHNPMLISNSNLGVNWEGKSEDEVLYFNVMQVGEGMIETFDFQLMAGESFGSRSTTDSMKYFMLNEEAVRAIGTENPIGMRMQVWGFDGQVIGVVKDFHHQSLMRSIEPVVLLYSPDQVFTAFIGIEGSHDPDLLLNVMEVYEQYEQEYPFHYSFIEEQYKSTYSEVITIGRLANLFSIAAIFISCLGLFGLSAFVTEQRTKETGIRKVLGASSISLLKLFSAGFIRLVLVAFIIASPVAWFYSKYWLADYAYRINLGILPFVMAGLLAILIALFTVGYNTLRAANANPVDALKDE